MNFSCKQTQLYLDLHVSHQNALCVSLRPNQHVENMLFLTKHSQSQQFGIIRKPTLIAPCLCWCISAIFFGVLPQVPLQQCAWCPTPDLLPQPLTAPALALGYQLKLPVASRIFPVLWNKYVFTLFQCTCLCLHLDSPVQFLISFLILYSIHIINSQDILQ